jgi:alpha-tubulin suppressor-like RCC1 family protein
MRSTSFARAFYLLAAAGSLAACSSDTGPGAARLTARLAAGINFTCALNHAGAAFCWGAGSAGQLGDGTGVQSSVPVRVDGGPYLALAAGDTAVCGIRFDRHVDCWGAAAPKCCSQPQAHVLTPAALASNSTFERVAVGTGSACGIDGSHRGLCWGEDLEGALGDGQASDTAVPPAVTLPGNHSFTDIDQGVFGGCGIDTSGAAFCWGSDPFGELGIGDSTGAVEESLPLPVTGGLHFTQIAVGGAYTCGITTEGLAACWGLNVAGQLGVGTQDVDEAVPTPVVGGTFASVFAGDKNNVLGHTCALDAAGAASCWGANDFGQLGAASANTCQFGQNFPCSETPVAVAGGLKFTTLAIGDEHTCGMVADGHVYCWGANDQGQLGNGTTVQASTPVLSTFAP